MTEIFQIVIENLEKVGIGALLFLGAYISNVCLGAWRNIVSKLSKRSRKIPLFLHE